VPRPTPNQLAWAPTRRWPHADAFWAEPMTAPELAALELKYATLLRLIATPNGRERDLGLRELAARWPGALREGQLASRERLESRRRSLACEPGAPRSAWRAAEIGVPLWAALHELLADVAQIRARGLAPSAVARGLDPPAQDRWPTETAWWSSLAWPLDARVARSWLAAVAELDPAALDRCLRE
jgi:hypothetical protein